MISSSSSETSRIARPSSRSATRRRCRYSIAPTSRPRVGCAAIRTFGSRAISRATTTFCWLPPESPPAARERPAAADVELADEPAGALDEPRGKEPAPLRVRRLRVVVQRDVLGDRELEHEPAPLAVLRDVPDARVEHLARARVAQLTAGDLIAPALGLHQAGDRVDQLRLAVAVDAGDADDLAGSDLERDAAHLLDAALVADVEILDGEQHVSRLRRRLLDAQEHLAADHRAGERRLGRALAGHRLDLLAAAQHGDPVGDLEHLVQLVADEDDRLPVRLQAADDLEELVRLLRRQHGGRLVEDEDVGAAVERLQDLDPLLLADGDVADERGRVDGEREPLGQLADPLLGARARRAEARLRGSTPRTMFSATVITGMSMKCWCTIPMPGSDRVARRRELDAACRSARISPASGR